MGYLGSVLTATLEEPVIEITLTGLVAYGSFIIAEHFHFSGVIACVVAGMISGNWGARIGMSASTRLAEVSFWDYAAFVLNSLVFLLVGFEVKITSLKSHASAIGEPVMLALQHELDDRMLDLAAVATTAASQPDES